MKRTWIMMGFILGGTFWHLACGKNLSPTTTQNIVVAFATGTPTPTLTATATPNGPTATPTPSGWNITGPVTLSTGEYGYGYVHVHPGGVLTINGAVTLNLGIYFALDAGATVMGDGLGYPGSQGLGAPTTPYSGGGGGHGGAGGADCYGLFGGPANDNSMGPTLMGSGGSYNGCVGGSGGGLFCVMVSNGAATLDGTITMNGITASAFCNAGYSGGAGGSIFIQANVILGSGSLSANGGAGTGCSGGGGGGIIVLSDHGGDNINSSAVSINGGAGAHNGGNGIFSEINF